MEWRARLRPIAEDIVTLDLKARTMLGMLTPSSNTVLEPVTAAMLADLADVSAHFGRFRVTEIALSQDALGQFQMEPMLAAAELLSHAKVGAIAWNGTSASWLGFENDERLCAAIKARTGIPAASSVMGLNEAFKLKGAKRIGLVSPYTDDVQERIVDNYARNGFEIVAERHLGERDNYAFSEFDEDLIYRLSLEVAEAKPDAITVLCTNMRGAVLAERFEAETGIPLYDSVSTALWQAMRVAGADPTRIKGWGSLFALK